MTIVVCVRVTDGMVLASDSATSFTDSSGAVIKVYNHADKIFNLIKGLPIGGMTYGNGAIGFSSISTIAKDLRKIFLDSSPNAPFFIDPTHYTIEEITQKTRDFMLSLYQAAYPTGIPDYFMGFRVCGYSAGSDLPEAWQTGIQGEKAIDPFPLYNHSDPNSFGPRWAGEQEALDRLILGVGSKFPDFLVSQGVDAETSQEFYHNTIRGLMVPLHLPAMPIQDAIDLAKFLAETAAKFTQFSLRAPTVGGTIELATITKHEGFKWVSRKHYYTPNLNPEHKS